MVLLQRRVTIKVMQNFCNRCDKAVYFAEAIQAMGKYFHRKCFVCSQPNCGRSLDSRTSNEHEGKTYCVYCYKSLFGPKGVGYGIGAGVLSTNSDLITESLEKGKDLPFTSTISYGVSPQKVETITNIPPRREETRSIPQQFYQPKKSNLKVVATTEDPVRTIIKPDAPIPLVRIPTEINTICRKCNKLVYEAEKILAAGAVWHKTTCFTCSDCGKRLESRTQCERQRQLYCTACYAKSFGPKGYGHGVGAGILQVHQ